MPIKLNGAIISFDIPTGAIMMGPVDSMEGFLKCDGSQYSRTQYAKLFALIGTNFGVGDGSTTFNVPDYRGCFLRGLGGNSAADMYTKQNSGVPNITGTLKYCQMNSDVATGAFISGTPSDNYGGTNSGYPRNSASFDASRSSNVYQNGLTEARPVNFAINYFIKY